jgi:hypothetical protein
MLIQKVIHYNFPLIERGLAVEFDTLPELRHVHRSSLVGCA